VVVWSVVVSVGAAAEFVSLAGLVSAVELVWSVVVSVELAVEVESVLVAVSLVVI